MRAGIGFAKTCDGSCALMGGLPRVRKQLRGALRGMPLLVGHSRKKFLGRLTGVLPFRPLQGFGQLRFHASASWGASPVRSFRAL